MIDDVEEHLGADQDDDDPFQSDVLLLVEARFDDRDQFQGEVQPLVENLRSFGDGEVVEDLLVETADGDGDHASNRLDLLFQPTVRPIEIGRVEKV